MLGVWLAQISAWISRPVISLAEWSPLVGLTAFFLGVAGAMAPCHLAASVGSITYFGNRRLREEGCYWREVGWYLVGKAAGYVALGMMFVFAGQKMLLPSLPLLSSARVIAGPLMVAIGLLLLGRLHLPGTGPRLAAVLRPLGRRRGGRWGAFLLGVAFSIGFCPTMFWLFFGLLMPLSIQTSYGLLLPSVFAVGTAAPLLLLLAIFEREGVNRPFVRKLRQAGQKVQWTAGMVLIGLGLVEISHACEHFLAWCLA